MRRPQSTLGCLLAVSLLVGSAAAATAASDPTQLIHPATLHFQNLIRIMPATS